MKLTRSDFPLIKWSALLFLLAIVAGSAAITASENFVVLERTRQVTAQSRLNEARKQLAAATEDRENMKTYTQEYSRLLDRNIIGSNQRLDWIEGLDSLHRQKRVLDFKYTISPQQPYVPVPAVESGNFELSQSPSSLQFELLHEGQLFNFLNALRRDVRGWFIIDRCTIDRIGTAPGGNPDASTAARLRAECAGGWLTLSNRNTR